MNLVELAYMNTYVCNFCSHMLFTLLYSRTSYTELVLGEDKESNDIIRSIQNIILIISLLVI